MSRRGRDALLLVYLIDILCCSARCRPVRPGPGSRCSAPSRTCGRSPGATWPLRLADHRGGLDRPGPARAWSLASWRLRPSCLAEGRRRRRSRKKAAASRLGPPARRPADALEGAVHRAGGDARPGRPLDRRPAGRSGSAWGAWCWRASRPGATWSIATRLARLGDGPVLSLWYGNSARFIGFLIQWAIGLRAAVTISSERERGTWDALLTSPLEGTGDRPREALGEPPRPQVADRLGRPGLDDHAWRWGGCSSPNMRSRWLGSPSSARSCRRSACGPRSGARRRPGRWGSRWPSGSAAYLVGLAMGVVVCLSVAMLCVIGWLMAMQAGLVPTNSPTLVPDVVPPRGWTSSSTASSSPGRSRSSARPEFASTGSPAG